VKIETLSTFPGMYDSVMGESIMKRAQEKGALEFCAHDLRKWTHDRHCTTDDYPYGGGHGLVMKCDPIFEATADILNSPIEALLHPNPLFWASDKNPHNPQKPTVIFLAPQGTPFTDAFASRLSTHSHLLFICGHYEGIDERAYCLADEVISLGDYVLTSGELASMVVIDACVRKLPGVLGAEAGATEESFAAGLLEFPQYTRPASICGLDVPDVLLSGHHENINKWRHQQSLTRTAHLRPDLIEKIAAGGLLSAEDEKFLNSSN
jgi:tRNA (guanine37-N1)-methyltransferase